MKTWTETDIVKNDSEFRKMRFGYKVMKELDQHSKSGAKMDDLQALEFMIWLAFKEDDPTLKIEQIEDILNECDVEYIKEKLEETIQRDMPGMAQVPGNESKNSTVPVEK